MLNEKDKSFIIGEVVSTIEKKIEKSKPSKFVLWSRSWFNYGTPPSIIAAIWFFASYSTDAKNLQFDTVKQKENVIYRYENLPTVLELDHLKRHTTEAGVHMPKNQKDSIYVTRNEYLELIKNNAIDMYNMKRTTDKTLEAMKDVNGSLRAINFKLDKLEKK